jgi:hypothetical protein
VASICAISTGAVVGVEVHCHVVLGHALVRQIPQECRLPTHSWIEYAPSIIISFAPLDTCTSLVEYDASLHKVNTTQKSDNCIYKR